MNNENAGYVNGVKIVKDMPNFNFDRHTEFVKDWLRKHPTPDLIIDGDKFDFIDLSDNIEEKGQESKSSNA
jgi:hypothetical protein